MKYISSYKKDEPYFNLDVQKTNHLYPYPENNQITTCANSRLFLSPLPMAGAKASFRRLLKIYPANQSGVSAYSPNPNNLIAETLIEWKSFGSSNFNRQLTLVTHLSRNELSPNSLQ